jgi:two-component system, LuxR family, response regulator FixJ
VNEFPLGPVIHVVDDDPAMRDSLRFLLETDGYSVRIYDSGLSLLRQALDIEPGCIITDIRMPGMNGLELVNQLKLQGLPHSVIVLTGHADVALAVAAMKAGVLEFLEKPFDDEVLLRAIKTALEQSETTTAQASDRSMIEGRAAQLTPRERDVFEAVIRGDSNKAAAIKLGISPRTIEIYRANVMEKMQAASLSELVRMAMRAGLA